MGCLTARLTLRLRRFPAGRLCRLIPVVWGCFRRLRPAFFLYPLATRVRLRLAGAITLWKTIKCHFIRSALCLGLTPLGHETKYDGYASIDDNTRLAKKYI